LDGEQKAGLGALAKSGRTTQRLAQRCRIVLRAAEGMTDEAIGKEEMVSRQKAARWRARYLQKGLAGLLKDKAGRGRPAKIKAEQKAEVVRRTLEETPEMATQWSTRRMGRECGMAASTVALIWQARGLKPHLARGFKLSKGKRFVGKLEDVVGLYLNAPEHALVLSCDEKSNFI
jgi:transposase